MKTRLVIHPFLFAMYPIIALFSYNIDQVFIAEIWRSLFWTLGATLALFLLFRLLVNDWERAGLLCSLLLALFFSYGHVYRLMIGRRLGTFEVGRADYLAALWATALIFLGWFILRKLAKTARITEFLNLISVFLLILPGYRILQFRFESLNEPAIPSEFSSGYINTPNASVSNPLPDIYYLIVDGYGRADILAEFYQYDNSAFVGYLESKGFCIARQGHTNYAQTALSLASSLNLAYVQDLVDLRNSEASDRSPLAQLVKQNTVRAYLSERGYQVVAFESGYPITDWSDADVYFASPNGLNSFESMLLSNSAAAIIIDRFIPAWYRERVLMILDQLKTVASLESPKLVFAHITSPHPPFVFGPNGEPRPAISFKDGNYYEGTPQEYIQGYQEQVAYLNQRLIEIVDSILENSSPEPIIILQADHGPGAYLNWDSIETTCLKERMSILNAYYLPGQGCEQIHEAITPVNSFRLVFDAYFNTGLGLTSDRSFFSLWSAPYELIDITDSIDSCNHPLAGQ